jgi:hypothetical protein
MTGKKAGSPDVSNTWIVRRLWSLADMVNFVLTRFVAALKFIDQEIAICRLKKTQWSPVLNPDFEEDKRRILNNLEFVRVICTEMALTSSNDRLDRINFLFRSGAATYTSIETELVVLRQSIEDDIKFDRFYHYPKAVAEVPIRFRTDWAPTLAAFPSKGMEFEILSGADCYALGQHTAAIFHFMRVVEYALRATAKKLRVKLPKNKSIEWSEWQHVLTAMGTKVEAAKQSSRGTKKAAELDFYSGALSHFAGFKDMYRDSVMHVRREYKDWEAEIAMRHVRDFMNKLSTRVSVKKRP